MPTFMHGLTFRIVATISAALSLLFLGNYFGTYRALNAALSGNVRTTISQTSQLLNTSVSATIGLPGRDMQKLEAYLEEMIDVEGRNGVIYVVIKDRSGASVLRAGKVLGELPLPDAAADYEICAAKGICHVRDPILLNGDEVGFLQYGLVTQSMVAAISKGYAISMAVTAVVTLLIFVILTLSGLSIARRLSSLGRATREIAMGNYNKRVTVRGRDELADLSVSFNRMAEATEKKVLQISAFNEALEKSVQQRTEELQRSNQMLEANVSHLSDAREQLVKTEKLAGLGALVAGVAHELNTPIGNALIAVTTIHQRSSDFSQLVSQGKTTKSALSNFIRDALEGSELSEISLRRAAALISSFKQVAVDQSSERRRDFDLAQTVSEVCDTFNYAIKKGTQRLEMAIAHGIAMDSYPGPLGQVVSNLINNALIHAFENRTDGQIRLSATPTENGRVTIQFSDNGCGIAEEHLKKIFDPFFTTRLGRGGSGLGLSIVNNIVEGLLGGSITVTSELGVGTTFTLDIPRTAGVTEVAT